MLSYFYKYTLKEETAYDRHLTSTRIVSFEMLVQSYRPTEEEGRGYVPFYGDNFGVI